MPKFYDSIPPNLEEWALQQPLFFTASAPSYGVHVNVSPKGLPSATFSIFDPNNAAYIDATGSGCETISHIYENGRVTIMFCSYEKSPRILRFFCWGSVIEHDSPLFLPTISRMGKADDLILGARAIIMLNIHKVQTSCGYGVPLFSPSPTVTPTLTTSPTPPLAASHEPDPPPSSAWTDRQTMHHWAQNKLSSPGGEALPAYQAEWNAGSLDGLPGLRAAMRERAGARRLRRVGGGKLEGDRKGEGAGGGGRDELTLREKVGCVKGEIGWRVEVGTARVTGVVWGQRGGLLVGVVMGVLGVMVWRWVWEVLVMMLGGSTR